jgi:hypothetical protein
MNQRFANICHGLKLPLLAAKYVSEIVQLWHDGADDQMPRTNAWSAMTFLRIVIQLYTFV